MKYFDKKIDTFKRKYFEVNKYSVINNGTQCDLHIFKQITYRYTMQKIQKMQMQSDYTKQLNGILTHQIVFPIQKSLQICEQLFSQHQFERKIKTSMLNFMCLQKMVLLNAKDYQLYCE